MDSIEVLTEQWRAAHELHMHEDNVAWQKFQNFMTIQGILAAAFALLLTQPAAMYLQLSKQVMLLLSLVASTSAFLWTITQRRGQRYQELRVKQAGHIEMILRSAGLPAFIYKAGLEEVAPKYKIWVSRWARWPTFNIMLLTSYIFAVFWLTMTFFVADSILTLQLHQVVVTSLPIAVIWLASWLMYYAYFDRWPGRMRTWWRQNRRDWCP